MLDAADITTTIETVTILLILGGYEVPMTSTLLSTGTADYEVQQPVSGELLIHTRPSNVHLLIRFFAYICQWNLRPEFRNLLTE